MVRPIWFLFAVLFLGGLIYSRAYGDTAMVVNASQREFQITLGSTTVPAGSPVRFEVTNNGKIQHEFVIEKAGAVDQHLTEDVEGKEMDAEIEAFNPGETRTLEWAFAEPGNYQVACHLPGHFEAGMVTQFRVSAASSTVGGLNWDPTILLPLALVAGVLTVLGVAAWKVARH